MAMVVNHNIPALMTYNTVNRTSSALEKSIQKLSTGLRINSAADDAAGLAISEKMRAQINGLDRAVSNAQDGISMIQTAEGALNETHAILQRMRELSVQAANDTLTSQDRGYIQLEIDQLREEITRIGNTTQFNKKKLLNGDAAVLWSSSDNETKALIKGGLRSLDQFGQKVVTEGNYNIKITATAGQGEIQKSDIFKVKHEDVVDLLHKNDELVSDVRVKNMLSSVFNSSTGQSEKIVYSIAGSNTAAVGTGAVHMTSLNTTESDNQWTTGVKLTGTLNGSAYKGGNVEMVVTLKSKQEGTTDKEAMVTFTVEGRITMADGSVVDVAAKDYTSVGDKAAGFTNLKDLNLEGAFDGLKLSGLTGASGIAEIGEGEKAIYTYKGTAEAAKTLNGSIGAADVGIYINPDNTQGPGKGNGAHSYNLNGSAIQGKTITLQQYYFEDGGLQTGSVTLDLTNVADATKLKAAEENPLSVFKVMEIGDVGTKNIKLRDLDKFWTTEGVFMLDDPKTITITQGDGKQTSVTLYANDTLGDVERKLNDAIANGLGQGKYIDPSDTAGGQNFVTYVTEDDKAINSLESVPGTFVIRSLVPGASGTVRFAGDENVINAFSLNTLQDARESSYTVSITDAHTGEVVVNAEKITGNVLYGKLHENVDVMFDAMAGVTATWNDGGKKFTYTTKEYETTLHLADNTTVFQIGANEGEDMGIHIGDMRATALGLDSVLVTDRVSAARSITIIDNAIDKVSTQRAKLGAYQNRLEHTINNLTTASENLTAAESRIRDTDMAKEMMNFTKLQIMLQAGTSMLAQANQLPQNVLALIR